MQRIILAFLFFCVAQANAIYISTSIGDSRIQSHNKIYEPGGIIHYAFEIGFLNAPNPENILDYKFAIGIDRFGYSHSDGEKSVSLWEVYLKPVVFSVTKHSVMFEIAPYLGRLLYASGLTDNDNQLLFHGDFISQFTVGNEYRLGYNINERFFVGLTANYHRVLYGFHHNEHPYVRGDNFLIGGWGLNFQYNLPW